MAIEVRCSSNKSLLAIETVIDLFILLLKYLLMHVQTDQGTNLSSQWSAQSLWHPLHDESTMKEVNRLQFSLNVCNIF